MSQAWKKMRNAYRIFVGEPKGNRLIRRLWRSEVIGIEHGGMDSTE
jgi:hypothetical protein